MVLKERSEEMKSAQKKSRIIKIALKILLGLGIILFIIIGIFFRYNLTYDSELMEKVYDAGYIEKSVEMPTGEVINYAVGPKHGPPILLIHGQGVSWKDYDKILPDLSKTFQVYSVDCFGHGESSHNKELYSLKNNGEALTWFINEMIKEPTYIAGHSSGGIIAAWIASENPSLVKGLLLEDPPLFRVTPEEVQEGKGAFAWYETYNVAHEFLQQNETSDYPLYVIENSYFISQLEGLKEPIIETARKYRLKNPEGPIKIIWLPAAWFRASLFLDKFDPEFADTFYTGEWLERIDQESMLKDIESKTIYLKASTNYGKDGVLYAANTEEDAQRVIDNLKNAERIDVKGGHSIHFEKPKEYVKAMKKMLED